MIYVYNADLLVLFEKGMFHCIAHQANCYNTMGAGIAKTIKQKYPEVYEADVNFSKPKGKARLGKYSYAKTTNGIIANFYGQLHWRKKPDGSPNTDVGALQSALQSFVEEVLITDEVVLLGLPMFIGAGLGGGDWGEIEDAILEVDQSFPTLEIVLVSLLDEATSKTKSRELAR